jgi:hypothetical protein
MSEIRVQRYVPEDKAPWDGFVARAKNPHLMFYRGFMEYHGERFSDHSLLFYDADDRLLALLPANRSEDTLYSHQGLTFGGLVVDDRMRAGTMLRVFDALKGYMRANGLRKLVYKALPHLYHVQPAEEDRYALFRHDARCYRLDTTSALDRRQPFKFSNGKKTGMSRGLRNGVVIRETDDVDGFYAMMSARLNARYDATPTHSAAEIRLLMDRFPQQIRLHGAYHEEHLVAACLMFCSPQVAHTQYITSSEAGRELRAVDALIGTLILETYAEWPFFDFGISNEQAGHYLNESLSNQKEEFGARTVIHEFYELRVD